MKACVTILFLMIASISLAQQSDSKWKGEFNLGDGFSLTTFLKITESKEDVLITSPKNADVRLFGGFKARLGRLLGKSPKKGIFLSIKTKRVGDSLKGNALLPVLGELVFKGILTDQTLTGTFLREDTKIASLTGVQTKEHRLSYTELYGQILKTSKDNIYSKEVLQTDEWKAFQKDLEELCNNAKDDIELFLGFNMLSPRLPFSHYNLYINNEDVDGSNAIDKKKSSVEFEEKTAETAYVKIKNFSTSKEELADVLPKIVNNKKYKNLIIDLRGNSGGGIEAASVFSKYLMNDFIDVGYFPTNKFPYQKFDSDQFDTLPEKSPETTDEFIDYLKAGRGAKMVFQKTKNTVFSGRIYILTDGKTASTCEPIVYVMKEKQKATIIGEKTAGAMLSGASFDVMGKYKLIVPIADFYTYDGIRIDQNGVSPNVEVVSEDALDKALELIVNNQ